MRQQHSLVLGEVLAALLVYPSQCWQEVQQWGSVDQVEEKQHSLALSWIKDAPLVQHG